VADELAHVPTLAGCRQLPLIDADLGHDVAESTRGASEAVGDGHGVKVSIAGGQGEGARETFTLRKRS
jgi:hypothetical protein